MSIRKLIALTLTLVLGLLLPAAAAAAPLPSTPLRDFVARPCAPGATYDPACDVDHDGDVDIFDIQKAAGHWNQTGLWTSDNNHDHLGQVWTGAGNPLTIGGAFAGSTAPLSLSNTAGDGLLIPLAAGNGIAIGTVAGHGVTVNSAGGWGIYVESSGASGVVVGSAAGDGVRVASAINGVFVSGAALNGVEVASSQGKGVSVGNTGDDGVFVFRAGNPSTHLSSGSNNGLEIAGAEGYGLYVGRADLDGVAVESAIIDGFDVNTAGDVGIEAGGTNFAGYFSGNVHIGGSCTGCLQAMHARNADSQPLAPGDVVALAGLRETDMDTGPLLLEVIPATTGLPLVGVVSGRADLVTNDDPRPGETGQRLAPRAGAAAPGDYVTVVYAGPMQVRISPVVATSVAPGTRLTASDLPGHARAVQTVTVDGVALPESAPVIGVALESLEAGQDMIWVLVNVQ